MITSARAFEISALLARLARPALSGHWSYKFYAAVRPVKQAIRCDGTIIWSLDDCIADKGSFPAPPPTAVN